jgi:hypothetical protein
MIPRNPENFKGKLVDIGNGQMGMVLGGYNKPMDPRITDEMDLARGFTGERQLKYHRNHGNDLLAVRELLDLQENEAGEWGTQLLRLRRNIGETGPDSEIQDMLKKARAFREWSEKNPIKYPGKISNFVGMGKNSNTFISSLLDYSGYGDREEVDDMPGYDAGSDLRFSPEMFGIKPDKPEEEQEEEVQDQMTELAKVAMTLNRHIKLTA